MIVDRFAVFYPAGALTLGPTILEDLRLLVLDVVAWDALDAAAKLVPFFFTHTEIINPRVRSELRGPTVSYLDVDAVIASSIASRVKYVAPVNACRSMFLPPYTQLAADPKNAAE